MNKIADIIPAKQSFLASLFLVAVVLAFLAPKAAVNVDEQLHYPYAKKVVNWYFTGGKDASCLQTPVSNLKYYGQSVDNFTALINRVFNFENEYLVRHYIGAVFFLLMLLFSGKIAYQLSGAYWVSTVTVVSLVFMPRLFGQAFGNLKDIPFATGYVAGIYFIIRFLKEMPKPRWSTAIWLGLAIAFSCSVRIGGLILFVYLALFSALYYTLKPFGLKQNVSTKPYFVRLIGQGVVILFIGYFVGLIFWPFALQNVISNPLESLRIMEHYKVSIRQLFEGNLLWSTQLPWYYLPKWLLISTPEFVFLGLIFYLITFYQKTSKNFNKQLFFELFVLFALLFPIVYVIVINSNLYSGVRQMLFILPFAAIVSSLGFFEIIKSKVNSAIKLPVIVVFFILMILPLKHQAKTFPSDYIYFNSISGGNKSAWGNFEYDYYFHGFKKSSEYAVELLGNERVTLAINCNLSNYFENYNNIKLQYVRYLERSSVDWDFGLFGVNYIHPELLKNGNWFSNHVVKIFFHEGNPVAVLLKRNNKNDFDGISELNKGNLAEAKSLLEKAVMADNKNVWLYVQLAKICLKQNDFEKFKRYLRLGKEIYPMYEPFFLLEAQYFFSVENYKKADEILNRLLEINPRYKPAQPLLTVVKEKLNL